MELNQGKIVIVSAEDDEEDRMFLKEAIEDLEIRCELKFVFDGEELLDYLANRNKFCIKAENPSPNIIFLDLNMPKLDGREALQIIKAHKRWKRIPVIALTTSTDKDDVKRLYKLGANSYISKPRLFKELVDVMRILTRYWFDVVSLYYNAEGDFE